MIFLKSITKKKEKCNAIVKSIFFYLYTVDLLYYVVTLSKTNDSDCFDGSY
jgi:hypothetical protein